MPVTSVTPIVPGGCTAPATVRVAPAHARVTYWTGWLSPEMEGCSKEVFALKDHFQRSRVFGLSSYYAVKASLRERYLGMGTRFYALFRAVAPLFDATSHVNHIYGGLGEWHFLRTLRRQPIVMTVAVDDGALDAAFYRHVRRVIVHTPRMADALTALGIERERIRTIYPGADLDRYRPQPRELALAGSWPTEDTGRFRILFATTPNTVEGITRRGVGLIMDAARALPDVEFYLPWRPWAGADALIRHCRAGAPSNVHVSQTLIPDMRDVFQAAHATVAPFLSSAGMKVCPTSLVESLACGRPLLVSSAVGLADVVRDERCGEVFEPTAEGLAAAITALRADYERRAHNARFAARRHFDFQICLRQHERLYEEVLRSSC
jgi:glycosyltransferase involved in cell wall biosynthesis